MKAKTEEFLYFLLWGADTLARPTYYNLQESFEGWAYRKRLLRRIHQLQARGFLESRLGRMEGKVYRLTELGKLAALGGRDPETLWNRDWDNKWRIITFDIPETYNTSRVCLRRYLKDRGFGCLQKSLWISPFPLEEDVKKITASWDDVSSLLTLEAKVCSGESIQSIVTLAWDFQYLQKLHEECLLILSNPPGHQSSVPPKPIQLQQWAAKERAAWQAASCCDPFLPEILTPSGYLGREVWRQRNNVLRDLGRWLK